ncbi:helix-turn-helix domain-containing protein [Vibrio cholerae]|nr:AraC family transcriptional regulator [Vibrio cholerae]
MATITRIGTACRKKSINDIASKLEFSSDSAFISFFKQQTGQTPLKYIR